MAQRGLPGATGAGADGGAAGDHGEGAVARRQNLETWKNPGKTWKNPGKTWKNPGKTWKNLEKPWKHLEKPWKNLEKPWKNLEPGKWVGEMVNGKHAEKKCWEHLEWLEIQH